MGKQNISVQILVPVRCSPLKKFHFAAPYQSCRQAVPCNAFQFALLHFRGCTCQKIFQEHMHDRQHWQQPCAPRYVWSALHGSDTTPLAITSRLVVLHSGVHQFLHRRQRKNLFHQRVKLYSCQGVCLFGNALDGAAHIAKMVRASPYSSPSSLTQSSTMLSKTDSSVSIGQLYMMFQKIDFQRIPYPISWNAVTNLPFVFFVNQLDTIRINSLITATCQVIKKPWRNHLKNAIHLFLPLLFACLIHSSELIWVSESYITLLYVRYFVLVFNFSNISYHPDRYNIILSIDCR